ncbi:SpoIIE family protein phosphatase [Streptomyces asiaticus]
MLDAHGRVLASTPAFERLLGYPAEELGGLPARRLWADQGTCTATLASARTDPSVIRPALLRHRDGHAVVVSLHILPLVTAAAAETTGCYLVLAHPEPGGASASPPDGRNRTPHRRTQRNLDLLRAAVSIEPSSDIARTVTELAALLAADFADLAAVDLAEAVAQGADIPAVTRFGELRLRRMAAVRRDGEWPAMLSAEGAQTPTVPESPELRLLQQGHGVLINNIDALKASLGHDPGLIRSVIPEEARSGLSAPLYARGMLLGAITVWRTRPSSARFDGDDLTLLEQIAASAALSLDNNRRSLREHHAADALRSSLLPRSVVESTAAETTGMHVPASPGTGVSTDWFDVLPLPGLRIAFVMGDVVGHGIHSAATMARVRTAVQTLADLDLEPDELLTRLDDLVTGPAADRRAESGSGTEILGATCLYGVYDPGTHRCVLASAGHPPPVIVRPDTTTHFAELVPGPPLGVGGMPFEPAEFELEAGSVLAFYTDGLVGFPKSDIGLGMERLRHWLSTHADPDRHLDDVARGTVTELLGTSRPDDAAVLLARTRVVPTHDIASWEFPADPSVVVRAREQVTRQLADWKLDDLAFTTELVVSELVTNAIRYASGPIGLRLIRDRVLVCEVSDPSNSQPRLRRARSTDEGGRGLFLVAQLTDRWGSRYTQSGKTIWTEQFLGTWR